MQKFKVEVKTKLSDFLLDKYQGGLTYGKFCKLLRQKDIKINGKRVNKDCLLNAGDLIECYYSAEKKQIEAVYKDENILVCFKPQKITAEDFFELVKSEYPNAFFTHRLDRNTCGLMVFALNESSYNELYAGFKNRTFKKYYHCLVYGAFDKKQNTLSDYIFKDAKNSVVKIYGKQVTGSKSVITKYEEVARGKNSSVLKVELVTGRTHQIRAHLAYYGHFIIGDGKYGSERINKEYKAKEQILIASSITFAFSEKSPLYYLNGKTFTADNTFVFNKMQ